MKERDDVQVVRNDSKFRDSYMKINQAYINEIKPIFVKSCFDCHGDTTVYPWYYKIPIVKQLIDYDIEESKKHLDFSKDFPFSGHEEPLRDLEAIRRTIRDDSMPPQRYQIMHQDKSLTKGEIKEVEEWIKESREILK